jgi:hypothetical protein
MIPTFKDAAVIFFTVTFGSEFRVRGRTVIRPKREPQTPLLNLIEMDALCVRVRVRARRRVRAVRQTPTIRQFVWFPLSLSLRRSNLCEPLDRVATALYTTRFVLQRNTKLILGSGICDCHVASSKWRSRWILIKLSEAKAVDQRTWNYRRGERVNVQQWRDYVSGLCYGTFTVALNNCDCEWRNAEKSLSQPGKTK